MDRATKHETLRRYIDSEGRVLPSDYPNFISGAQYEECCVFCGYSNNHSFNPTLRHITDGWEKVDGLFHCDDCAFEIDAAFKSAYFAGKPKIRNDEAASERIYRWNTYGMLPREASYKYLHLDHHWDTFVPVGHPVSCLFCEDTLGQNNFSGHYIQVARDTDYELTGGKVAVCNECEKEIEKHATIDSVKTNCKNCNDIFYVSKDEYNYLVISHTLGQQLCPNCAYANSILTEEDSLFFLQENSPPRSNPPERYVPNRCLFCTQTFTVDLAISSTYSRKLHLFENKVCCEKCQVFKLCKTNNNKFVFGLNENKKVYTVITKTGSGWSFRISRIKGLDEKVLYLDKDIRSLSDTVIVAHNWYAAQQHNRTTELWEQNGVE